MKGWNPRIDERREKSAAERAKKELEKDGVLIIRGMLHIDIPMRNKSQGFKLIGGIAQGAEHDLTDEDITTCVRSFCEKLGDDMLAGVLGDAPEGFHSVIERLDPENPRPD